MAVVAGITFLCLRVFPVNATTVALTFLIAILAAATRWGFTNAAVMSVAAMFCFNFFFLPPVGTFTVADPQNWVALFAFLVTALVASRLSHTAQTKARDALRRQQEVERLYELSRNLMLTRSDADLASEIPASIARVFDCEAVSYFDRHLNQIHSTGLPIPDQQLRDTAIQGSTSHNPANRLWLIPVSLGGKTAGALAVARGAVSEAALQAAANLVAIALEKQHAQAAAARAEAAQESEQLKSTLLDAIAHELKTPLTSIRAASTALLSEDTGSAPSRDLLTVINEETERLNDLISDAIRMARIEAGKIRLERGSVSIPDLLTTMLAQKPALALDHPVTLTVRDDAIANGDREMLAIVFRQLLSNAAKYSIPGAPIAIAVTSEGSAARVTVTDQGPGIDATDRPRIFERFYRSQSVRGRMPGTGMGLTIASEIVKAHDGEIGVDSKPGQGASFWFTIPLMGP